MSILNRLTILCAILRHLQLLVQITLSGELQALKPRAFIVDQLSAGLPLMRFLYPDTPILFYCHFPDLLLAQGRQSALKRLYRVPFDWIEEWSMGFAQAVAVNSEFTKGVVARTWPRLKEKVDTKVVYPCVDTTVKQDGASAEGDAFGNGDYKIILSINRFERKKDIGLAVKAFAAISEEQRKGLRLVLAGMSHISRYLCSTIGLISCRRLRSPCCRKRRIPRRAPTTRLFSFSQPPHRHLLRRRLPFFDPKRCLRPLPPLHTKLYQDITPPRGSHLSLHTLQRTFRHCAS